MDSLTLYTLRQRGHRVSIDGPFVLKLHADENQYSILAERTRRREEAVYLEPSRKKNRFGHFYHNHSYRLLE